MRRRWIPARATGVAAGPIIAVALALSGCAQAPRPTIAAAGSAISTVTRTAVPSSITTGLPAKGSPPAQSASAQSTPSQSASVAPSTSAATECPVKAGFDCDFQRRMAAVDSYLKTRPGTVGIVLRDRSTGAVWRNAAADVPVWTASTIKLAMAVDLLARDRSGAITLTDADRATMDAMLHSSDDDAADTLWFKYAGADHLTFNRDFTALGMTSLVPQAGFTQFYPYWGFQKCTPDDLDRLMQHVLTTVNPTDRAYLISELRHVAPDQQWGVWATDAGATAGSKDGWSLEQGGWVMNTVGFSGPGQRYTLAVMNSLNGQGGYDEGRATDTRVAELLLAGR